MDRLLKLTGWNPVGFQLNFIFIAVFISCSDHSSSIQFNHSELNIPIDSQSLSSYYHSDIYSAEDQDFFIGYNHTTHAFDIFDLKNKRLLKSIVLSNDGPNAIPSVGRFAANRNYIAVINGNAFLYFLNHDGDILKRIIFEDIPEVQGLSLAPMELVFGNFSKTSFSNNNTLTMPIFQPSKRLDEGFYNDFHIMEMQFDGLATTVSLSKVNFPEMFRDQFYGDLDRPYVGIDNEYLMYNFPVSSTLYRFNEERDIIETFELTNTNNNHRVSPPLNKAAYDKIKLRREYFFNSARYFYPVYDRFKGFYYIVRKDKTEQDSQDNKSGHFLMVFNENFSYLGELEIDPNLTPIYGVIEQGVLFSYRSRSIKSESYLSFYIIDISLDKL